MDIKLGPDGALYIADWYDRQIDHYRNHEGQIDPSNGRIYRLRAKQSVGAVKPSPGPRSSRDDRAGQAASPIPTGGSARRRLRLIGDRKDAVDRSRAEATSIATETGQTALEALWALNLVGGLDEATGARDARACRTRTCGSGRCGCSATRARSRPPWPRSWPDAPRVEPDVEVRSQLACSAKRLPAREALPIVARLAGARRGCPTTSTCRSCSGGRSRRRPTTDPEAVLALFQDRAIWDLPIVRDTIDGAADAATSPRPARARTSIAAPGCWPWRRAPSTPSG